MSVDKGTWFENQKEVDQKIQNLDVNGNSTGQLTGTETTYVADGAIDLTDRVAILDASSASTFMTLADGTYVGQEIVVACTDSTNAATVTIGSPLDAGADFVAFTAGDLAIFRWTSAGWGAVQGVTVA